ncbi:MAG: molybdopterin biosynthesis protein MoeB [Flavobacteriaceae bacterium]|nr:MAG: molybdopterin biosynthesis protein MoeB [Flavobacteriaceae bacterium]
MNRDYNTFFKRQITLDEIGLEGQKKLGQTKVLIVGCGGLGSTIAVHVAASGIGAIHLMDFDVVALSNLHRQVYYCLDDVGASKSETLAVFIKARAPFTKVTYTKHALEKTNVIQSFKDYDIIVDATDNLAIKYLINDACVVLGKPMVYGSLYKFEGYVATFNHMSEQGRYSTNLRDAFPKIATDIPTCETVGTLNSIVGIIAMLQVNEVLKIATETGELLIDKLLIYNSLRNSNFILKLEKTQTEEAVLAIFKEEKYLGLPCDIQDPSLLISASDLKKEIAKEGVRILSVIEMMTTKYPFKIHETHPLSTLDPELMHLDSRKKYIVICHKGISSYMATVRIKKQYPTLRVCSLIGGIDKF